MQEVILLQSSIAIQVRFIDLAQPLLVTGPSDETGITGPSQLSEAVAPLGPGIVGLHPVRFRSAGQVRTGSTSSKQISIWKGVIKSFRSAVFSAEDFVLINRVSNGSELHCVKGPVPPISKVRSIAASTNYKG